MNKDKVKLLFAFLPLLIVVYFFISNLIFYLNADEVKFITTAYDPYDIVMGRYLDVQIENDNKYIMKEILGPVSKEDSYEGMFIKYYKGLGKQDKELVRNAFDTLVSITQREKELGVDWYDYRDLREYRDAENILFTLNDELDNTYSLRELIDKQCTCKEQGEDLFDIIEEVTFKEVENDEFTRYLKNFDDKHLYIPYTIDENGYAELGKPSFKKPDWTTNYIIEDSNIDVWSPEWITTISVFGNSKRFYIDERLAAIAEHAIQEARSDGKVVSILCKNVKGRMQIKQLLIDEIDLYDYLEKYKETN